MSQSSSQPFVGRTSVSRPKRPQLRNNRLTLPTQPIQDNTLTWLHRLVTTDFFPSWNRYRRHLKTPIAVLVLSSVVTSLCGWLVAPQLYLLSAASACVIAIGMVYPWLAVRAVNCRITFPKDRNVEGEVLHSRLIVHNKWPIPVWGLAVQRGFDMFTVDELSSDDVSVALAHVSAWSRNEFRWEFIPRRRGTYPQAVVNVTCAFPFGLWTARQQVHVDQHVVVWPRPVALNTHRSRNRRHSRNFDAAAMATGKDSNVTAIRPYRSGDAMRDVHWSATARLNELMVKERQRPTESHTRIIIHIPPKVALQFRNSQTPLDWAVRVATSMCDAHFRAQTPFTLEFGTRRLEVRSSHQHRLAMDALAVADLAEVETECCETGSSRESHVRITIGINETVDNSPSSRFAIEVSSCVDGTVVRDQTDIDDLAPTTLEEFHRKCDRLSTSLDRLSFCPNPQVA